MPKYIYIKDASKVQDALNLLSDNNIFAFVSSLINNKQVIAINDYHAAAMLLAKNGIWFRAY